MADLALGVAKDIFNTGMAIKDAVDTFHQNKEECQDIKVIVDTVMDIVSQLQETGLTSHPAMYDAALRGLQVSLDGALKVVTKWQKRNGMCRFLMAGDMAKELRRVQDDIQRKMNLGNFAMVASMMLTIEWTRTTTVRYEGARPPPTQPQNSRTSSLWFGSSGVTEFSLSETVATHHVSEESMDVGSGYTSVTVKQKFVLKMQMTSDKSRCRALSLVASVGGVDSVGITGDAKDLLEVVGDGVDCVKLITALRKKVAHAELLMTSEIKPKDEYMMRPVVVNAIEEPPRARSCGRFRSITAKFFRFMRPRARKSPAPSSSHLLPDESSSSMTSSATTNAGLHPPRR